MATRNVVRIQLEIPGEKYSQIEALMQKAGLRTKTEFINNALTLLSWAIREVEQGRSIASVDKGNERYREILLPALENVAGDAEAASAAADPASSRDSRRRRKVSGREKLAVSR